jgi:hypothetical protein
MPGQTFVDEMNTIVDREITLEMRDCSEEPEHFFCKRLQLAKTMKEVTYLRFSGGFLQTSFRLFYRPNTSCIVNKPFLPAMNSAARTAPVANPSLLCAVWRISISSIALE